MELIHQVLDFFLHLDKHLDAITKEYGVLTYAILFLIVFVETGLIVMPLLPGDSLLFAAGMLAARPDNGLNIAIIIPLLILAALLGDNTNYFIGKFLGDKIKQREKILFFKREYIDKTQEYYAKHGGKTVIIARFIPIVRTVAPFVAGAGSMKYATYITYCIIGALLWVVGVSMIGYLFGNIPFIRDNFEKVIFGIIGVSVLPVVWGVLKEKFVKK
jgi:membrane-associated protein